MAVQINNESSFLKQNERLNQVFLCGIDIPKYVFKSDLNYFLCFEFDFVFSDSFLLGIQNIVSRTCEKKFTFYVEDPLPAEYYLKHFGLYNVAIFNVDDPMSVITKILMKDPGNSPADSILINSNVISIFSESNKWAVKCSREFDVGVIGFCNLEEQNQFINQFGTFSDMFLTPQEYLDCSNYYLNEYQELAKNYVNTIPKKI